MASPASAKSQPLHNFSLPQLRWKKNSTNNLHSGRLLTDSPPHQSPPRRHQSPSLRAAQKQSPKRESASESKSGFVSDHRQISASAPEGIKCRGSSVPDCDNLIEKLDIETKSKIYIRVPRSKSAELLEEENNQESLQEKDENSNQEKKRVTVENHEIEDFVEPKTWNLRPRKPLRKPSSANNGGTVKIQENKSLIRPQSNAYTNIEENKEKKKKFSITLTREEIEEDIFILTGSKPSRKPKKRAKNVQKQLDNLFPGKWLSSVTPDCYKVPDPPKKGQVTSTCSTPSSSVQIR